MRAGKHYSVNCPLREGMDDKAYRMVFQPVLQKVKLLHKSSLEISGVMRDVTGEFTCPKVT